MNVLLALQQRSKHKDAKEEASQKNHNALRINEPAPFCLFAFNQQSQIGNRKSP